ncbi:hypothetical protein K402DRAFT_395088 [Aulographum hederae CBS 113979]|uniref:Ubiquitin-like domain-containing protein n=1 Tax=Aulographum hederae CBS 113979 TaxID=1176131 RepID=A0A6G1GVP7_9PEZI|nr:hypothetical protein K402DRAFT_395088 [Aulographum hederae CBS 113979]
MEIGEAPDDARIIVSVVPAYDDEDEETLQFAIRKTTPMRRVIEAYASRKNKPKEDLRFLIEGERVYSDSTAETLDLQTNDVIDVYRGAVGGAGPLLLVVVRDRHGNDVWFKLPSATRMLKLKNAYASHKGLTRMNQRFTYKGNIIRDNDTADLLQMQDQDVIAFRPSNRE